MHVTRIYILESEAFREVPWVDWIDISVLAGLVLLVIGLAAVFSTARPKRRRDDGDDGGLTISAAATSDDRSRSRTDWDGDGGDD
jgi:hypothetical protein